MISRYCRFLTPALLSAVAAIGVSCSRSAIEPRQPLTEHLVNPALVDETVPRVSWVAEPVSSRNGITQTAYRIVVASTQTQLLDGDYDVWDSGKVLSADNYLVPLGNAPLAPGEKYYWRVMVWDDRDQPSHWSETATFGTGINDFGAKWIGDRLLRRNLALDREIASARIYATAMGWFDLEINGKKVSDNYFVPNFTNYTTRDNLLGHTISIDDNFTAERVMYLAYDVDSLLVKGDNELRVHLGNGWASPASPLAASYGDPRFMCRLDLTYTDGTRESIVTDELWQQSPSPIVMDDLHGGEIYDANVIENWTPARVLDAPKGELTPHCAPVDRILASYKPVRLEQTASDEWEVEFPVEIAGWIRLDDVIAAKDDTVTIDYICESRNGVHRFISSGDTFSYAPRFSWFVFSKAKIKGISNLSELNLTAESVGTDLPLVAEFSSSDDRLQQILAIWQQAEIDNLHSGIQSDCPHRERMPYTGDGQVSMAAVLDHFDAASFYRKWLRDMRDAQNRDTGYVPNGAPWQPVCGGGVAWGAAMSLMPWEYYVRYGDREFLAENYQPMKAQLGYMKNWMTPDSTMLMLRGNDDNPSTPVYWLNLGEWVAPFALPSQELVHTFYLWLCADYTARAAEVLGHNDDADSIRQFRDNVADGFHRKFYDHATGSYGEAGSNVFALRIGVPQERRDSVIAALRHELVDKHGTHLDTGIFGTRYLFEVLSDNGMHDLAYAVLTADGFPGFMHWINQGATTTWECWNGADSHNHPMFGGGLTWLRSHLAGLRLDEKEPGYRHFFVEPATIAGVDSISFTTMTPQGRVAVNYIADKNLEVTVPVGSTATVTLPWDADRTPHQIAQGTHTFSNR